MLFCPPCWDPPKFTGALLAQKEVSRFRSRLFSWRDFEIKFTICNEDSDGSDWRSRRRTLTPTLALKYPITRGNNFNSLWFEASTEIENGCVPNSDKIVF